MEEDKILHMSFCKSVCPLPEQPAHSNVFTTSKMDLCLSHLNVVTSTQNLDQSSFTPTIDGSADGHQNSHNDKTPPHSDTKSDCSFARLHNYETRAKLKAMKALISKMMGDQNRNEVLKPYGELCKVVELCSWFVHFVDSLEKSDSYNADVSSISEESQESVSRIKIQRKRSVKEEMNHLEDTSPSLAPVAEETFYTSENSGGESLDGGNLVYAPWVDRYYYPAEIKRVENAPKDSAKKHQQCTVVYHEPESTETDADPQSLKDNEIPRKQVHYKRIFNHEKLPVGSVVHAQKDPNDCTSFERGVITQVMGSCFDRTLAKFNYAYMVLFEESQEVLPMKRDQVIIELQNLKSVMTKLSQEKILSPSPKINLMFKSLSLDAKDERWKTKYNPADDPFRRPLPPPIHEHDFVSKEDSKKMGTPRTPKLKELKRTSIDRLLSDSTEQALSAKKTHKIFTGVSFMLTGYKYSNDTFLMDASSSVKQSCEREMRPSVASDTRRSLDLFEDTNEDEDEELERDENLEPENVSDPELVELISSNGGRIVQLAEDLDKKLIGKVFLLAPKYVPTVNYLSALALNIPCISGKRFVQDSISAMKLVDESHYVLPSGIDRKTGDFIEWRKPHSRSRVFDGITFFLPVSIGTNHCLSTVLKLSGADVAFRERFTRSQLEIGQCFAIATDEMLFSQEVKSTFEANSVPVVNVNYIVDCLAYGRKLEFFEYLVD